MIAKRSPRSRATVRGGFTLLEILIVVAIIVVLAGVATMSLLPQLEKAKEQTAYTNMKTISDACVNYSVNNGSFPPDLQSLCQAQPNGGPPIFANQDAITSPWGANVQYQYDPSGSHHSGSQPDLWVVSPKGVTVNNWDPRK
jgi:general secretion pathway protein G